MKCILGEDCSLPVSSIKVMDINSQQVNLSGDDDATTRIPMALPLHSGKRREKQCDQVIHVSAVGKNEFIIAFYLF